MATDPIDSVDKQFEQLKGEFLDLKNEFKDLQQTHSSLVRKLRASGAGVLAISCICLLSNSLPTAFAQGYGTTLRSILQRITTLETKTKYLTTGVDRNGYPASYFTACNVYIQDGLGSTSGIASDPLLDNVTIVGNVEKPVTNGLGNLIIGYNEPPNPQYSPVTSQYTGSHNLIIGGGNQYSSFGAIIGGSYNYSDAAYGTILNGQANKTTGVLSIISSGQGNVASGFDSAVNGGDGNTASGIFSAVSGGVNNTASGGVSTVSGGDADTVSALFGWAGGSYHTP